MARLKNSASHIIGIFVYIISSRNYLLASETKLISTIIKPSNNEQFQPFCTTQNTTSSREFVPSCSLSEIDLLSGLYVEGSEPRHNGQLPPWINLTLARQGQQFANDYVAAIGFSHLFGLIMVLMFPDARDVLLLTQNSDTPEKVTFRYTATIAQVLIWYQDFLKEGNETDILTSLKNVRDLHVAAAQRASESLAQNQSLINATIYASRSVNNDLWDAFLQDLQNSSISKPQTSSLTYELNGTSLPVNQFQQAMTQFAFVGFPVLFPDRIGIDANDEEIWAFNHLWAVLGYALGIDDKYNIALQPDLNSTRQYYQTILDKYYLPLPFSMDFTIKVLIEVLLQGFGEMVPALTPNIQLYRLLKCVFQVPGTNMYKRFNASEVATELTFETQEFPLFKSNPVYRKTVNSAVSLYVFSLGHKYYGEKYTTQESRANNVYYS